MAKITENKQGKKNIRAKTKPEKYINPLTDFGFKHIFKDKESMLNFLNAILKIKGDIIDLTYGDTERTPHSDEERVARFDLYCTTGTGEHIIIEMQNSGQKYFKDRTIYYITSPIQEQAPKGGDKNWNYKLTPVYSVNILNFSMKDVKLLYEPQELEEPQELDKPIKKEAEYITRVQFMDIETKQIFSKKVTLAYLELPLFDLTEDQLKTDLEKWTYVLKNLPNLTDLPKILDNNVFRRVFHIAAVANLSKAERQEYNNSLKNYRDMYNSIVQRDERITSLNHEIAGYQQREAGYQQREAGYQQREATKDKIIAELRHQLDLKGMQGA
jgi:predicted transposase/invertase (TIGR01784 family)